MEMTTGVRRRVALYGHDTCGLGHVRRNLALAQAAAGSALDPDVLLISGTAEAGRFPRPAGVELMVLPSVHKDGDSGYRPGALRGGLGEVVALRTALLEAALLSWQPDMLVVDKVPQGFAGELVPALAHLRRAGRTHVVLGLRDVLDDPIRARADWHRSGDSEAARALYDEIWVYGDRRVHDLTTDLGLPADVAAITSFTGYLSSGRTTASRGPERLASGAGMALCLVGGGLDGAPLAWSFARAPMPAGVTGVLVTGPFLPAHVRRSLEALARDREDLLVIPFSEDVAGWAAGAAAVVTMGGYNTVAEVLATDTPALVVPRVQPRREQAVRAAALVQAGAIQSVDPDDVTPHVLGDWLAAAVAGPPVDRTHLALDGLAAVTDRTAQLLSSPVEVSRAAG